MPANEALRNYLTSVQRITGAGTASLFLCSASEEYTSEAVHEGALPPVPEMQTAKAIRELATAGVPVPHGEDTGAAADLPVFEYRQSSASGAYLLGMRISGYQAWLAGEHSPAASFERRRPAGTPADIAQDWMLWIGLRYRDTSRQAFLESLVQVAQGPGGVSPESAQDWALWSLALGGYLAWEAHQLALLTQDPISQLPGRVEFQACLQRELDQGMHNSQPVGLLLVNPDEFGLVNHRLGHDKGDAALHEIARRLSKNIRSDDQVFRYGGAVFGVVLPGAELAAASATADKLRHALTRQPYLEGTARFAFSVGVATHENYDTTDALSETVELLRHADQALNVAKLSGGAQTVSWSPDGTTSAMGNLDRLSGIFTADTEKDYRNMLLLWDTITIISSRPDTTAIAEDFVNRIGMTLKPERVGLLAHIEGEPPRLLAASCQPAGRQERTSGKEELTLSDEQHALLAQAHEHRRTERARFGGSRRGQNGQRRQLAYAVPLVARNTCLGCLYLDGPEEALSLDTSDMIFLDALANQIAVALDRAELATRWKQEQERESARLRAEVQELRQTLQHTRLVHASPQMDAVLGILRKVAPTDVTVLINGESGTGKEMLARTLHELSARSARPFITVDCGAIAHSLMEAELFGHTKGAYTGAQSASPGRIAQAESGTLFLDEIGEIPLEIQVKLLRFLQEKEFTPVGGTQTHHVDVRIIAATNRELADEVASGRFRNDLYYRLQVVTVTAPPLRERPTDILPLARHFLEKFSVEYGKHARSLNADAEDALLEYPWPGNVRELQHRILQAVVMSEQSEIDSQELRLGNPVAGTPDTGKRVIRDSLHIPSPHDNGRPAVPVKTVDTDISPWMALQQALKSQVATALGSSSAPVPLGRWLAEDLVLAADRAANGIASRASAALGMAETTFRRRLEKVKREFQSGLTSRTGDWSAIEPVLSRLVTDGGMAEGENTFERARQMLLDEVVAHVPDDRGLGSALMGVTAPTYSRWTKSRSS